MDASGQLSVVVGGYPTGDGGPAVNAHLYFGQTKLAFDSSGNLFHADNANARVRRISPDGVITTVLGNGLNLTGPQGLLASQTSVSPTALAVSPSGELFVAEYGRIRKIKQDGTTVFVAGTGTSGYSGDGGPATAAQFSGMLALAFDRAGNLFVADVYNYAIRKIDTAGFVTTIAGKGTSGEIGEGVPAKSSSLNYFSEMAVDPSGNVYFVAGSRLRRIDTAGILATAPGFANHYVASFGIDADGRLLISDGWRLGTVTAAGQFMAFAGNYSGDPGERVGTAQARLFGPQGIVASKNGEILFGESGANRIRKISFGFVVGPAGGAFPATGGSGSFTVNAPAASTTWSVSSNVSWVKLPSGLSQGSGSVIFQVDPNPTGLPRIGLITTGDQIYTVHQVRGAGTVYSISGHVTLNGAGLPGVTMTMTGSVAGSATTDATGNYSLTNVPAGGSYVVTPSKSNHYFTPAGTAFTDLAASQTANFTAVSGAISISGSVGVAGATLTISGALSAITTSTSAGAYSFTGLPAGGDLTVTPTLAGYSFTPATRTFAAISANQVADFVATRSASTISLDRTRLSYAARSATVLTPFQKVLLSFTGGGTSAWTASSSQSWLQVTPASGTGSTRLTIALVPGSLPAPGASTATVTITAPGATNPTLTLPINLSVLAGSSAPFGNFDTPTDGATNVAGAIPVTGWAMDDILVAKVEIFRDPIGAERPVGGLTYIGDALFVANARPDIEGAYRTLPFQYRGGWGYMMLTNMIPPVSGSGPTGNGTIRIWAVATDVEGNRTNLGSKTIALNNAAAKRPFGALDTPGPGAIASGTAYATNGWVLTPQPNIIASVPITVYVDSTPVGNMTYGIPRGDIALYFPGYRNTNGAGVTYNLDTTKLTTGVHSIAFNAYDDASPSNGEGIGSRYFFVENGVSGSVMDPESPVESSLLESTTARSARPRPSRGAVPQVLTVQEMAWLTIPLPEGQWRGAHVINNEMRPLPVGSTLDNANGVFRWHLGAGFLGRHELLFASTDGAVHGVTLNIEPKTYSESSKGGSPVH